MGPDDELARARLLCEINHSLARDFQESIDLLMGSSISQPVQGQRRDTHTQNPRDRIRFECEQLSVSDGLRDNQQSVPASVEEDEFLFKSSSSLMVGNYLHGEE